MTLGGKEHTSISYNRGQRIRYLPELFMSRWRSLKLQLLTGIKMRFLICALSDQYTISNQWWSEKKTVLCNLCEQVRVERSCKVHLVWTRCMDTVVNTKALTAERGWITISPWPLHKAMVIGSCQKCESPDRVVGCWLGYQGSRLRHPDPLWDSFTLWWRNDGNVTLTSPYYE
jgi:hypothetical protein